MKKAVLLSILVVVVQIAGGVMAQAQQAAKVLRIGYLSGSGDGTNKGPFVEALRQGLLELGYVDRKNLMIEYRGAEGQSERTRSDNRSRSLGSCYRGARS